MANQPGANNQRSERARGELARGRKSSLGKGSRRWIWVWIVSWQGPKTGASHRRESRQFSSNSNELPLTIRSI